MMNGQRGQELAKRTKDFALRIIRLYSALSKTLAAQVIGKQVLRSGTAVGAHYREAMRSRSTVEFISKVESALQELEETGYWLELLCDGNIVASKRLADLQSELQELTRIFVSSVRTAKQRKEKR